MSPSSNLFRRKLVKAEARIAFALQIYQRPLAREAAVLFPCSIPSPRLSRERVRERGFELGMKAPLHPNPLPRYAAEGRRTQAASMQRSAFVADIAETKST